MKCPNCKTENLLITERKNVEIDYCPKCRGVWLDKGELDKLIELSTDSFDRNRDRDRDRDDEWDRDDDRRNTDPRRRKSFLGEVFDF